MGDLKHVPTALMEFDNKLFIYCKGYVYLYSAIFLTGLKLSFPTIFVFDLESETIEYAGYLKTNPRKDTLSLSIVKE